MRIVMLSCNTGEGHNSTAKAVRDVLERRGVECDTVDVLACLSPSFSKFVCSWHERLYKYAPKLWDVSYRAFEKKHMRSDERDMLYELLRLGCNELQVILENGKYDAVFCPHAFSAMMMTELRRSRHVDIPCYFISTDYTCPPYVDQCDMDGCFLPASDLAEEFLSAGIPEEKMIATGIPVRQEFYRQGDKQEARETLGLSQYDFVAILMCGSMGCGPMKKLAQQLPGELPENSLVVVICGKNEKLYQTMSQIGDRRLRVLGYCNQVPEYMDAADMIITKPGGLSSTEAANKGLPMVFINAVGGCESRNFDFFLKNGYAVGDEKPENVLMIASRLAASEEERQAMTQALRRGFSINSAQAIADTLIAQAEAYRQKKQRGDKPHTLDNLINAVGDKTQAMARFRLYADVARREDQEWAARVFEQISRHQASHTAELIELLNELGGQQELSRYSPNLTGTLGSTHKNLAIAQAELNEVSHTVFPEYAAAAKAEGYWKAEHVFNGLAEIAAEHAAMLCQVQNQLDGEPQSEKTLWYCLNCGYSYEGTAPCDCCPVCEKGLRWQAKRLDGHDFFHRKDE